MNWIRSNLLAIVVLVAIIASFAIGLHEANVAERTARIDNAASCVRANARTALTAAYQRTTADARRVAGTLADTLIADDYAAYAHGSAAYLEIARYHNHPGEATRVRRVEIEGEPGYVLTQKAYALVEEGCSRSFGLTESETEDLPEVGPHRDDTGKLTLGHENGQAK